MEILVRLKRAVSERRARHADRIRHLDRLGQPHDSESPHQLSPWEEIFARPEWRETTANEPAKPRNLTPYIVFWSVAITVSIVISLTVARLAAAIAYRWFSTHYPGKPIDSDLVGFGQTYLLVSGALLILLLFTYILEKLDLSGKGR